MTKTEQAQEQEQEQEIKQRESDARVAAMIRDTIERIKNPTHVCFTTRDGRRMTIPSDMYVTKTY